MDKFNGVAAKYHNNAIANAISVYLKELSAHPAIFINI
jgi:hypothetical protein